jgi:hypothetical protein
VLPKGLAGHDVLAPRQWAFSLWFLPAVVSPVPAAVSRVLRGAAVLLIVLFTVRMLTIWHRNLVLFESLEVSGLDWVMEGAPWRKRLHYVKLEQDSDYFGWRPFVHVEKFYMGDRLGQTADTPGILSTSAIRYKKGAEIHRITAKSPDWPKNSQIWENFDVILTRRWNPTPEQRVELEKHGELVREMGDWALWRSREAKPMQP